MAWKKSDGGAIPHATDHNDFLNQLVTFATANGWAIAEDGRAAGTPYIILRGTGLAGTDNIYIGFRRFQDTVLGKYGWELQGFSGYQNGLTWDNQPGAILRPSQTYGWPVLVLRNSSMPFWFAVNGRRMVIVAKVGTVYCAAYLGFILPYGTPGEYPYPLFIGGSAYRDAGATIPLPSDSVTTGSPLNNFYNAIAPSSGSPSSCQAWIRDTAGAWIGLPANYTSAEFALHGLWPYCANRAARDNGNAMFFKNLRPTLGGGYSLDRIIVVTGATSSNWNPANAECGELDGCFFVPGFGLAAEDTFTIGADTYTAFPNVSATGSMDFFALKNA